MTEDPFALEYQDRTDEQLWEFLVFSVCVAGKSAAVTQGKVNKFIRSVTDNRRHALRDSLYFHKSSGIRDHLGLSRMGQYDRIAAALYQLACLYKSHQLRDITVSQLEEIFGIGPKTARFFAMYALGEEKVAALDTHILKWLKVWTGIMGMEELWKDKIPDATPAAGPKYRELEELFLYAADMLNLNPRELDTAIWRNYATKSG